MKKIRIGVIGCGVISGTHIEAYQALPDVEVTWVCDIQKDRLEEKAKKYGIPHATTRAAEVFAAADVDAVSVCTDHASHLPLCVAALKAGKDVLCEKAYTNSRANLKKLLSAVKAHPDRVFSAVFQHRFDPVNLKLKELLAKKAFGTLLTAGVQLRCHRTDQYYFNDAWRGTWAPEGGSVLVNQAIHYIDQLFWQMGEVPVLEGFYANLAHKKSIETEDTSVAVLRFPKAKALGTLEATNASHINWESTLFYHGTEGSVEIRDDKILKLDFADPKKAEKIRKEIESCKARRPAIAGKSYYGTGHIAQIQDFVDAVRKRRAPFVQLPDAAKTLFALYDIYDSQNRRDSGDPEARPRTGVARKPAKKK